MNGENPFRYILCDNISKLSLYFDVSGFIQTFQFYDATHIRKYICVREQIFQTNVRKWMQKYEQTTHEIINFKMHTLMMNIFIEFLLFRAL